MGSEWATIDTVLPEKDLHTQGTIRGPNGKFIFWVAQPRPKGVNIDTWEEIQQTKWNRIFSKGGS